jgi:hypothetical protein
MLLALVVRADDPHFGNAVFADNKDGDSPQEIFSSETPEIFLRAELMDVAKDTELRAAWVAEKTDAAELNYELNTSKVAVKSDTSFATFSLPKPTTGWPIGTYRVDLTINDKLSQQLRFKILKKT